MELVTGTSTGKKIGFRNAEKDTSGRKPTTSTWDVQEQEKTKCYIKRSMSEWSGASEYPLKSIYFPIERLLLLGR